ncbi:hypothetical protein BJF90_38005 [Pseudonocardia sp. CNS-004]|nr:hypothetical protein BJF90_38005 [Pseudonocardia sp. CNS-004]
MADAVGRGDLIGAEPDRPVVVDDAVIVRGRDEQLHAFEITDGAHRWSLPDRTNGGGTATVARSPSATRPAASSTPGTTRAASTRSRWRPGRGSGASGPPPTSPRCR